MAQGLRRAARITLGTPSINCDAQLMRREDPGKSRRLMGCFFPFFFLLSKQGRHDLVSQCAAMLRACTAVLRCCLCVHFPACAAMLPARAAFCMCHFAACAASATKPSVRPLSARAVQRCTFFPVSICCNMCMRCDAVCFIFPARPRPACHDKLEFKFKCEKKKRKNLSQIIPAFPEEAQRKDRVPTVPQAHTTHLRTFCSHLMTSKADIVAVV